MSQLRRLAFSARPHAAAFLLLAAAACGGGGGDGATAPGGGGGTASKTTATVAVPVQITVPANAGTLKVQAAASYDRQGGAAGALGASRELNAAAGAQTLSVPVDLASCLADTTRAGGSATTTCAVHLQLTLTAGGTAVDARNAGPFTLAGGASLTSSTTITFAPVAAVQVVGGANAARAVIGTPLPLTAQALDAAGNVLADRAVRWTSSAPAVATVDSLTGVVTPVTAGSASITASVAGHTGARTVNVVAPPQQVAVTVAGGTGSGSVTSTPAGYSCRVGNGTTTGTCAANFASDSAVTLQAVPDQGVTFSGWGGDCAAAGTVTSCTLTPNSGKNVTVTFVVVRQIKVTPTGSGNGAVTSSPAATFNCRLAGGVVSGACSAGVLENVPVTLTATADAGSTFAGWSGPCTGTASTCTVPLTQAQTVGAVFNANSVAAVTLQTAGDASGLGGGYVSSAQVGSAGALSCHRIGGLTSGAVCSDQFGSGTQVTLTATADAVSTFTGWSGPCAGSGTTCTFTVGSGAVTPVATFAASSSAHGVSVAPTGSGTGSLTITTTIQSAACDQSQVNRPDGGTCIAPWDPASVPATVTIRATPAAGSRFTGWVGCPAGGASGTTCTVSRNGVYAVAASFDP